MGEPTMEEYMTKTREDYGSGDNTFSGSENEDANEHIEKVLEIVDLFNIPEVTQDQIMLRVFLVSLTEAASRWLRNEPAGSIIRLDVPIRQILDSKGAIPTMNASNARKPSKIWLIILKNGTMESLIVPFPQGGRYRAAALKFYQRDNGNPSYQERRPTMEESLSKFMAEFAKRHDENSNLIKEI
ncbi:hypothetical protein Tco_0962593 [Tanacetum coccineum]